MPPLPHNLLTHAIVEETVSLLIYRESANFDLIQDSFSPQSQVLADYILEHCPNVYSGRPHIDTYIPDLPEGGDMQAVKLWCIWDVLLHCHRTMGVRPSENLKSVTSAAQEYLRNPSQLAQTWALIAGNNIYTGRGEPSPPSWFYSLLSSIAFTAGFDAVQACTIAYPNVMLPEDAIPGEHSEPVQMPRIRLLYLLREHLPVTYLNTDGLILP